MWRKLIAVVLALALPAGASAGPLAEAAARAGREAAFAAQAGVTDADGRSGRFWTGVALLIGGGALIALGAFEVGDDEDSPGEDDDEDNDGDDPGEDGDGVHQALLGTGIAAAGVGSWLVFTGRSSSPSIRSPRGVALRHTIRF